MYEFATGAVVVTGVFLAVLHAARLRYLGTFVVGPVLLTLGLAVTVLYTPSAQLVPALQSYWLLIHVTVGVRRVRAVHARVLHERPAARAGPARGGSRRRS